MFTFHMEERSSASTPENLLTLEAYLKLVEEEENMHPEINRDTRLMITKFRKVYYDTFGWNDELIRGTAKIFPFTKCPAGLSADHHLITVPGDSRDSNNRLVYDVAHIWAILDSQNYPGVFSPWPTALQRLFFAVPKVKSRVMASGWLGDLSSVTGQFFIQWKKKGKLPLTNAEQQAIVDQFAPGSKMVSDADSMVIPMLFDIATDDGLMVSEIVQRYFLGTEQEVQRDRNKRFTLFCDTIGLKDWDGKAFGNEEAWLREYTGQLRTITSFYIIFFDKSIAGFKGLCSILKIFSIKFIVAVLQALSIWLGGYKKQLQVREVLVRFLTALKAQRAKELDD